MAFRNFFLAVATFAVAALPVAARQADDDPGYEAPYAARSVDDSETVPAADPYAVPAPKQSSGRVGYAHVTAAEGTGSVLSDANGRTEMRINLPLSEGDQLVTRAAGRAEVELADGNRVQIAGESGVRFDALAGEQGSGAEESALTLLEGSLAVETGTFAGNRAFRVDTPDASVYVTSGVQARINLDPRRGHRDRATGNFRRADPFRLDFRPGRPLPHRAGRGPAGARQGNVFPRSIRRVGRPAIGFDPAGAQFRLGALPERRGIRRGRRRPGQLRELGLLPHLRLERLASGRAGGLVSLFGRLLGLHPRRRDVGRQRAVGMVPPPLRQLVLRCGLRLMVLVARIHLLAGLGVLGILGRIHGLVPDRLLLVLRPMGKLLGWGWGSGLYFSVNGVFDRGRIDCGRLELRGQ
jgi:hypothetical protein